MAEDKKVEDLYQKLANIENEFDRSHVLSVLYTRIAAGFENKESGFEKITLSSPDPAWEIANKYLFELSEKDPERAVDAAVEMALLPESDDLNQEKVNKWIRTSGLTLLGSRENIDLLDKYLGEGKMRAGLVEVLMDNFEQDLTPFDKAARFNNPTPFTTVQSIYIGLGLGGAKNDAAKRIHRLSLARSNDEDVQGAVNILKSFPGCEYLSERF